MSADKDAIAEFIRTRGVTKCPPAVAASTTATVTAETAAAHAERGLDPVGDAWRRKNKGGWTAYWQKRKAP